MPSGRDGGYMSTMRTTVRYCTKCTLPSIAATPVTFNEDGVCSGCRVEEQSESIDWRERREMLKDIVAGYRSADNYDCIIPVSGGKDSYFQTHVVVAELGLKPLLVTYHGNNYYPEGEENLFRMREVFDVDHIIIRPSVDVLIRMNRLGFKLQGDMNWHAHCGIYTVGSRAAVQYKVPLVIWGEHGFMYIGGMHSFNDFIEFTAKFRLEHGLRGYDWHDFTDESLQKQGRPELKEGLSEKDLKWGIYPMDDELDDVGVRGIFLSNFMHWNPKEQVELVKQRYGWKEAAREFERTYRKMSNLDDMHENGIHDYLKFMKLGYGRATDHTTKDIRHDLMSREEGIRMVMKYDHVKPRADLERWLKYVNMSEEEFDYICDTFRDPRVWWIEDGQWWKDTIAGEQKVYGAVHLPRDQWHRYMNEIEHEHKVTTR